ncbi:MAG: histidine--tRNA ligase [Candidatus Buchananbacteria bacterium]
MGRPKKNKLKKFKPKEPAAAVKAVESFGTWQTLKGFKDILPTDQKFFKAVKTAAINLANLYGFKRIDLPILEETGLFVRGTGKTTDIVEKEMFSFVDKSGENVALRPEVTPSVVRAYLQHGMVNLSQPVKLYYVGQAFRRENPQSGRLRQFQQFGLEVVGEKHPAVDAELIFLGFTILKNLGLETEVVINSLGCPVCRPNYQTRLVNYYSSKTRQLCLDCKKRLSKNPLRLLDCKEESCQSLKAEAPQIVDHLCEECKSHLMKVLEYLDNWEVSYSLNPQIVRGLDYYTKTVWEYWPKQEKASSQNALGAGGRYDNLVETLGGVPTPAAGLALGIERIVLQLKEKGQEFSEPYVPEVYVAQLGEQAKLKAMVLYEELRRQGFKISASFYKDSLRQQLEVANKLGVKISLILGQQEMADQTILIREMESGTQEVIDFKKTATELRKKLDKMVGDQTYTAKEVAYV